MKTISFHISTLRLAALAGISLATPAFAVVNIDYVPVGNAGNAADATGYGAVAYPYKISKYETTISQYAAFLNAKAQSDPYGLYNPSMGSNANIAGITRSGSSGSYSYAVVAGSGNRPITYVEWFDAARFANWLHNGQGSGSTETGAYTLNGATSGIITKNAGASVWIAGENEWYKAAYYDPTPGAGGGDNYWLHAMRVNAVTNNTVSANYYDGDYVGSGTSSLPAGNGLTNVGAYGAAISNYGTFDQGGNVWEWNDAVITTSRGLRGGSWLGNANFMPATLRHSLAPTNEANDVGFRVVSAVPPVAAFTATPNPVAPGQMIGFNAGASTPSATIVSYAWNWGDGSAAGSGVTATHHYGLFGSYVVTLTVTDSFTQSAVTTITVNVNQGNQAPVANAGGPYVTSIGDPLELNGSASADPNAAQGDSIVSYAWDLNNDGAFDTSGVAPTVPWATLQFLLATPVNYPADPLTGVPTNTVQLRVTDGFGATHTAATVLRIYDSRPFANAVATPNPAAYGESITFSGVGSSHGHPDHSIVSYAWDFGDAGTGSGVTVQHAFAQAGIYVVSMTVTDDNAPPKTSLTTTTVTVSDAVPPVLTLPGNLTVGATSVAGAVVTYSASASDPGSGVVSSSFLPASGSTFPIGTTTVNASATDGSGNSSIGSFTVTVLNSTSAPVFTAAGTVPLTTDGFDATGLTVGAMTLGFDPAPGEVLTLVNNTSANPIGGAFTDLPDGGTILTTHGGRNLLFIADYTGGDGNDLTLTLLNPELAVEQPSPSDIADGGSKSFGTMVLGNPGSLVFTIKNTGPGILNGLTLSKSGTDQSSFIVTASPTAPLNGTSGTTTFTVQFNPTTSGAKTAVLHIASDDADENPFDITLTGQALSPSDDTDSDGLNDAAEFLLAMLGYDWQLSQPALVNTLMTNANIAGLYTQPQIQGLNVDAPLLTRDPLTGKFKLTLGIQKSADLFQFDPFPFTSPDTTINPQGKLEFEFTGPGNAAFFRLGAE